MWAGISLSIWMSSLGIFLAEDRYFYEVRNLQSRKHSCRHSEPEDVFQPQEEKKVQNMKSGGSERFTLPKEFLVCLKQSFYLRRPLPWASKLSRNRLPAYAIICTEIFLLSHKACNTDLTLGRGLKYWRYRNKW